MLANMKPILTRPAASAVVVIDEARGASMSEIARSSGLALSTVQRAIDGLIDGGVVRRTTARGPLVFRPDAPKGALRELAEWTLGRALVRDLRNAAVTVRAARPVTLPPTVKNRVVRRSLPGAIDSIVEAYHPERVILFGSQARGDATQESDVDLLVLFDGPVDRRERELQLRRLLRDAPFAKDVLVASNDDLPQATIGTAVAEAVHDGVVVYER
jgi:predicted nucleotidyltransferase